MPQRPDVLYLAHRTPYPPDKGDRIRTFHLLRCLSRHARIHLACLADEPAASAADELRRYCERVEVIEHRGRDRWLKTLASLACGGSASVGAFRSRGLRAVVREWATQTRFHAAVASSSSLAPYLRCPELAGVPAVIDLMDLDSQKWHDYAASARGPRRWLYALEGRRLRRLERGLAGWAAALTFVSEAEAELYRRRCGAGPVHAVGNGVDLDYFAPAPQADSAECVFVGALDYRPNVEGARWFCEGPWREIRRRRPDARLSLVGRKPAAAVWALGAIPGVEVVGQVPDVRPYVARAAVAVVPLHIARGVQNKVLEALAMCRATVATPAALEGLWLTPGREALSASSADDWVEVVVGLLARPQRRAELGDAGRRYVEASHCWERCTDPFAALLGLRNGLPKPLRCQPTVNLR